MGRQTKKLKKLNLFLVVLLSACLFGFCYYYGSKKMRISEYTKYVSGEQALVVLYNQELKEVGTLARGTAVLSYSNLTLNKEQEEYSQIKYKDKKYYIKELNLCTDPQQVVAEQTIYVRTPTVIYKELESSKIKTAVAKGTELMVLGFDEVDQEGFVKRYHVKQGTEEGYIYGKYIVLTEAEALKHYEPEQYYQVHADRGDSFKGGHAGNLDYYPVVKPNFKDNKMPEKVYALYLNSSSLILNKIDRYIELAKATKINAFVVDIKDNQAPGYKSLVFKAESPTNYQYANNSFESYQEVIKRIKTAGFYVIGRITVFKDKYYVQDNPDIAIIDKRTNEPFYYASTYWPSPYQRKVWEFNVELAKEAVQEMGFNEIQFDYVRFPDRTANYEGAGHLSFRNDYNEEKAQAIQRFLMYACDELHQLNAYVAADVFGETAYNYVTAYGQYWPAISNVVDVISGMPYPDHFNKYEFGFKEAVWTVPYELLNYWGKNYVMKRQLEIPTPALIRTWIQMVDVPNYKHPGGFPYHEAEIEAQIKGLFDAGLDQGYMTWLSYAGLERYQKYQSVFSKEF